jgi:S-ribosylhomocysteine lyase
MPDIDHRLMTPPCLRVSHELEGLSGITCVWDLRVGQPNVSHLEMSVMHSLEHFLAAILRAASDQVVAVAPMGCQTGFYIVTISLRREEVVDLLTAALERIIDAEEVPMANNQQCGWAENHSLVGAKEVAMWLLQHSGDWRYPQGS